jgi:hypothetical protein
MREEVRRDRRRRIHLGSEEIVEPRVERILPLTRPGGGFLRHSLGIVARVLRP